MADEQSIARYRQWYRKLLCFYTRPHHDQFAESMEQTFGDLCRERVKAGKGLAGFVLWTFVETSAAIFKDNLSYSFMQRNIRRIAMVTGLLLLIPLFGNMFVAGWNWSPVDFVIWGMMVFGAGLAFELVSRRGGTTMYRAAVGVACLTGFFLVWVNAAVGIIGDEGSANAMYLGVLVIGFVGALLAGFAPRGMSRALLATAVAQALVPVIALAWVPEERFAPGVIPVMGLNGVFVAMWLVSAALFRFSANSSSTTSGQRPLGGTGREGIAG